MRYYGIPDEIVQAALDAPQGAELRTSHGDLCRLRGEGPDRRGRLYLVRRGIYLLAHCHNCGFSARYRLRETDVASLPGIFEELQSNFENENEKKTGDFRLVNRILETTT